MPIWEKSPNFKVMACFVLEFCAIYCLKVENTPPPSQLLTGLKTEACDSTDQAVLQRSYTGRVQIMHGGPEEGCVLSFQLEKKRTLSLKVDVKIYCSILKVS